MFEQATKLVIEQKQFKIEAKERREKLLELAKKIGFWNMEVKLLAKEFKVSERVLYKDIKWLKGHYRPQDIREIRLETDIALKKALRQALLLTTEADPNIRAKAINCVNSCVKELRDHLESWGEKSKVAEKVDINNYVLKIIEHNDRNDMGAKPQAITSLENPEQQSDN